MRTSERHTDHAGLAGHAGHTGHGGPPVERSARGPATGASVWSVLGVLLVLAVAAGGDLRALQQGPLAAATQVAEATHRVARAAARDVAAAPASPCRQQPFAAGVPLRLPRQRDLRHGGLPMPRAPDRC
jgi:hypothetical protein